MKDKEPTWRCGAVFTACPLGAHVPHSRFPLRPWGLSVPTAYPSKKKKKEQKKKKKTSEGNLLGDFSSCSSWVPLSSPPNHDQYLCS
jgi:hypothetical protein